MKTNRKGLRLAAVLLALCLLPLGGYAEEAETAFGIEEKGLTLGYDFSRLLRGGFISKARLYVSAQNLLTITKYSGMDPELGYGFDEDWVSGIDLGYYPSARSVLVGVNIQF